MPYNGPVQYPMWQGPTFPCRRCGRPSYRLHGDDELCLTCAGGDRTGFFWWDLSAEEKTGVTAELNKRAGCAVPEALVVRLLNQHRDVLEKLNRVGADTATMDEVCDMVALHLVGQEWPTFGQSAGEAFFEALHRALDCTPERDRYGSEF